MLIPIQYLIHAQGRIGSDDDIHLLWVFNQRCPLCFIAIDDLGFYSWCKLRQFVQPVIDERWRRNHKHRLLTLTDIRQHRYDESDALQGFAESHVISQDSAEFILGQQLEPTETRFLVIAEYTVQTFRYVWIELFRTIQILQKVRKAGSGIKKLSLIQWCGQMQPMNQWNPDLFSAKIGCGDIQFTQKFT